MATTVSTRARPTLRRAARLGAALAIALLASGCAFVQGARVASLSHIEGSEGPDGTRGSTAPFWVGFALNPFNSLGWVVNRLPIPFLDVNTLPMDGDETVKGFRYYLPKPFLLVVPDDQGGVTTHTLLVPDPSEEYAIHAWTSLGTQGLQLRFGNPGEKPSDPRTDEQLLTRVGFTLDNATVAEAAITSAGTAATALATKLNEIRSGAATSVPDLQAKIDQAKLTALQARLAAEQAHKSLTECAQNAACRNSPKYDELSQAYLVAKQTQANAENALDRLKKQLADASSVMDQGGAGPTTGARAVTSAGKRGPALFEIVMTGGSLELRPVDWLPGKQTSELRETEPAWLPIQ